MQVIVQESSGLEMLESLQKVLQSRPSFSHVELVVIRGLVGRLAARAIYDAHLDGTALRRILEADTLGDLSTGIADLVAANPRPRLDPRIEKVLAYLRLHYPDRRVTRLEALAAIAEVTPTHLSRLMRKSTGEGVVSHTRRLRIARAAELLAMREGSLAEVARAVGYRHQSDFSRDFHRVMGVSPSHFARRPSTVD